MDLNKGLTIDYNYLNLPKTVSSASEGKSIGYTYDATGKKLKKTFDNTDHYYFDGIEYDGSALLFAMTEEGRVRPCGDGTFTYDYFLKDHLGNVRVVLGTGSAGRSMVYPAASMETMTAATESTYYSNLDKVRSFTPVGFKSIKKNERVAHLKGTDPNRQIGPSITIKVNSGDTISLTAQSFYPDNTGTQRTGLAETALGQLVNAMISPSGLGSKGKAMAIERLKAQGLAKGTGYQDMMNKLPNSDYNNENNRPKAYMVWMLFNKEMKLVKTGRSSGARQIPEGAGQVKQMAESGIVMDQGGFLTAYTVNESPASVYIDNFQVTTTLGQVLDENTYYPFGMLNEMQSNPGYTDPVNNYKYNGKELQNELSLQWLDYGARFYDPQIGSGHSVDPLSEKDRRWSPYNYGVNNPIRFIDPDGMFIDDITAMKDGTYTIKKTDDKFDRFYVEKKDGSSIEVAQLDKHLAADGKTTLVDFPSNGKGFNRYREENSGGDHSVQPLVAAALFGAVNEITTKDPNTKVSFGDMSGEAGNKPGDVHNGGALSHVNGKNVDVRLIRTDNADAGTNVNNPTFDVGRNQSAVNSYNKFGFKNILSQTNSKGFLLNNTIDEHHPDHFHLQGFNPIYKFVK